MTLELIIKEIGDTIDFSDDANGDNPALYTVFPYSGYFRLIVNIYGDTESVADYVMTATNITGTT